MAAPKERQTWIFDKLIANPNLGFSDMFSSYLEKFGKISEVTFSKDWKKAVKKHSDNQQAINKAKLDVIIKEEIKAVKRDILSKHDAMEILSKIAKGLPNENDEVPTPNEQRQAIETLGRFDGWVAPIKTEVKDTTEKPPIFGNDSL